MPRVAVLGAGGHTGRMTVEALRALGADPIPLARSRGGPDAQDQAAVERAIEGADALVNLAGPFLRNGLAPVRAAIARRVPYVDTTGEQAFMARVREELHEAARDADVPVVNAVAYEYALGDLAARAFFPEGGDALHVLYRSPGARGSAGTKKSVLRVLAAPTLSYEDGRLVTMAAARHRRTFATADGPRTGVSFAGGEVLTVPRHTPFRTVRTYVATRHPARARALAPLARVLLRGPGLRAAEAFVDARHVAPRNEDARAEVHLVAEPSGRRVAVRMRDPYAATAHIAARGALALIRQRSSGVLSPAEAFDARDFLEQTSKTLPGFVVEQLPPLSGGRV